MCLRWLCNVMFIMFCLGYFDNGLVLTHLYDKKNLKLANSLGLFWWSELREQACRYQNKGFGVGCHNVMSNVSMGRGFDRDLHTHQISYSCSYTWTKQRPNVIKGSGISARRFGALLGSRLNAGIPSYSASDSTEKLRDSQGIHTSPLILSGGRGAIKTYHNEISATSHLTEEFD